MDWIHASILSPLKNTQVSFEEDRKIIEWLLYKNVLDNLKKE
jgi:hypothetical protein